MTVNITTHSTERYFRGFIIQAYDPTTGSMVGHFLPSADSRPIDSCSASTHRNNLNKHHISLTWVPPAFSAGGLLGGQSGAAGQWLSSPIMPAIHFNVNNQKRQLPVESPPALVTNAPPPPPQPAEAGQTASAPAPGPAYAPAPVPVPPASGLHQVKFKATIVVTYEDFYTGFESSDQKYDKFDFAPKPAE